MTFPASTAARILGSWPRLRAIASIPDLATWVCTPAAALTAWPNPATAASVCLRCASSPARGIRPCALCQMKVSARSCASCWNSAWVGAPMSLLAVSECCLPMAPPTVLLAA